MYPFGAWGGVYGLWWWYPGVWPSTDAWCRVPQLWPWVGARWELAPTKYYLAGR